MKTRLIETKGLKRKLEFIIPSEEVEKSFAKSFKKVQKGAQIKGFREGKAPIDAVKQTHYKKVWDEVLNDLFRIFYPQAISESQIKPVGDPALVDLKLEDKKPCTFIVEMEVHPQVEVKNYLNLEIKKEKADVSEQKVQETLDRIRDSYADYRDVLEVRPLKEGDWTVISLEGYEGQQKIKELDHKELLLNLGENKLAPDFDKYLMGLKQEAEKSFDFRFPQDHPYPTLANKTIHLKVKVKAIKKKELPEFNDEFAKKFKVGTFVELKQKIKKDLEENTKQKVKESVENQVITKLVEANPVDIPQSLTQKQKLALIENSKKRLSQYGMDPKEQMNWVKENENAFEKEALFSLKSSYLVDKLIQDLKIDASEEDIEKSLKESYPSKTPEEMKKELQKHNYWSHFLFNLKRQKVIHFLIEKAKVTTA